MINDSSSRLIGDHDHDIVIFIVSMRAHRCQYEENDKKKPSFKSEAAELSNHVQLIGAAEKTET